MKPVATLIFVLGALCNFQITSVTRLADTNISSIGNVGGSDSGNEFEYGPVMTEEMILIPSLPELEPPEVSIFSGSDTFTPTGIWGNTSNGSALSATDIFVPNVTVPSTLWSSSSDSGSGTGYTNTSPTGESGSEGGNNASVNASSNLSGSSIITNIGQSGSTSGSGSASRSASANTSGNITTTATNGSVTVTGSENNATNHPSGSSNITNISQNGGESGSGIDPGITSNINGRNLTTNTTDGSAINSSVPFYSSDISNNY